MFQISKPTKDQILHTVELTVVTFVISFATVWTAQPDPFSKAAVIAGLAAGGAAIYRVIKSLLTTV
ncbi:hypothetical protein AB4Y95_00085 [Arthrobacter sp. M-10]|uniref:hypothetical protein n=1 Tax=Arthrobacter sp. M-10 TaxID=3233037 RepID=UPI003F8F0EA4